MAESPPTPEQVGAVALAVERLRAAADRLVVCCGRSSVQDAGKIVIGPQRSPGTYVVIYYLPMPLHAHIVGKLGTFDFPPGNYAYVGSAFGGGGVAARVARHLDPHTVKRWNVDYLKDVATPWSSGGPTIP